MDNNNNMETNNMNELDNMINEGTESNNHNDDILTKLKIKNGMNVQESQQNDKLDSMMNNSQNLNFDNGTEKKAPNKILVIAAAAAVVLCIISFVVTKIVFAPKTTTKTDTPVVQATTNANPTVVKKFNIDDWQYPVKPLTDRYNFTVTLKQAAINKSVNTVSYTYVGDQLLFDYKDPITQENITIIDNLSYNFIISPTYIFRNCDIDSWSKAKMNKFYYDLECGSLFTTSENTKKMDNNLSTYMPEVNAEGYMLSWMWVANKYNFTLPKDDLDVIMNYFGDEYDTILNSMKDGTFDKNRLYNAMYDDETLLRSVGEQQ